MDNHTRRLINVIFTSLNLFRNDKIDEKVLLSSVESVSNALENNEIKALLDNFAIKIEESLYLYDVDEGKKFLLEEIKLVTNELSMRM